MAHQTSDGSDDDYDIDSPVDNIDPDEPIDFGLVYALHTFVANLEGQVCVLKGDSLELLDDSNSYWWLVKCIKTDEIGYIPAENVETPFERLARLNKTRNVDITIVQDVDLQPPPPLRKPRRNIVFPETFVEYINYTDDEYSDDEFEPPPMGSLARPQKPNHTSLSRNFLSKLLSRTGSKKAKELNAGVRAIVPQQIQPQQATVQHEGVHKEPINVLRIYAGNVDLKATFKTVALTKSMTATDLLAMALRRFRIPGANPKEYYMSVLHMDSQEKRLGEKDNVYDTLEDLRHKGLPGVGDSASIAKVVNSKGGVSSIRMTDDNIIKVIINKKLNLFEKNYHLIRIFMYDESDPTGRMRTYKTIGVNSNTTVGEIIAMAVKKFKLRDPSGYTYSLHSIFKGQESLRDNTERIYPILMTAEGSAEDIDFVLRREWTGEGVAPSPMAIAPSVDTGPSLMDDIQSILQSKPAFLEELPAAGGRPALSPQMSYDSFDSSSLGSVSSPSRNDSSDSLLTWEPTRQQSPLRQQVYDETSTGEAPEPPRIQRKHSTTSTIDEMLEDVPVPPSVIPDGSGPLPLRIAARASSLRYEPTALSSTLSRLTNATPATQAPAANPAPPSNHPYHQPAQSLNATSPQTSPTPMPSSAFLPTFPQPPPRTVTSSLSPLDGQSQVKNPDIGTSNGSKPDASTRVKSRSSRANFETMEEYLEEILKGNADVSKLRSLEEKIKAALQNTNAPPNSNRGIMSLPTTVMAPPRPYDDCGLKEILKPRTQSLGANSQRPRDLRKSNTTSVSLSNVFNSLQADLEESISKGSLPRPSGSAEANNPGARLSSMEWNVEDTTETPQQGQETASPTQLSNGHVASQPLYDATDSTGSSREKVGPPPLSAVMRDDQPEPVGETSEVPEYDSAVVMDKYKEVEAMLSNMQRDLDALVANQDDTTSAPTDKSSATINQLSPSSLSSSQPPARSESIIEET